MRIYSRQAGAPLAIAKMADMGSMEGQPMAINRDRRRDMPEEAEQDPVLRSLLNAPVEDEPLTPAEDEAIAESYEDIRLGRVVSSAEMRRQLGLPEKPQR
jgi:hypothetical protein